ncbi:hypothetical protein C7S16_4978 [Burkholderia thailandensis]|uniref:Uncharacterized protein n=1 Tax=Burkholderia thailandensis TaxID=57975 RepID=A0AAW9CMF7_BURTH|nr:hypothetical protein [Burkholderia thailandensis]MDW9250726.1 hypothetical protein [Burkholderia thailandensis]
MHRIGAHVEAAGECRMPARRSRRSRPRIPRVTATPAPVSAKAAAGSTDGLRRPRRHAMNDARRTHTRTDRS